MFTMCTQVHLFTPRKMSPKNNQETNKRKGSEPFHKTLSDKFRQYVLTGHWEVGRLIPSEQELCDQFSTSRTTVRKALDRLINEGLISRKAGKGTWVKQYSPIQNPWRIRGTTTLEYPFPELITVEIYSNEVVAPDLTDPMIAGFGDKELLTRLKVNRHLQGTPLSLAYIYFKTKDAEQVLSEFNYDKDVYFYKVLERATHKQVVTMESTFDAIQAVGEVSDRLKIPQGTAILTLTRLMNGENGELLQAIKLHVRSDLQKIKLVADKEKVRE